MGLSHNGLRQKMFMTYEEMLRVPMIWSNPCLLPDAKTTDALVSHVDVLLALCELVGVPNWRAKDFQGVDYSQVVLHPDSNTSPTAVEPYVLFTFDDICLICDVRFACNGEYLKNRFVRTADGEPGLN